MRRGLRTPVLSVVRLRILFFGRLLLEYLSLEGDGTYICIKAACSSSVVLFFVFIYIIHLTEGESEISKGNYLPNKHHIYSIIDRNMVRSSICIDPIHINNTVKYIHRKLTFMIFNFYIILFLKKSN